MSLHGIGTVFELLFWLAVVGGVVVLVVRAVRHPSRRPVPPCCATPLEALAQRYAKGEISHEQYEQMKKELTR